MHQSGAGRDEIAAELKRLSGLTAVEDAVKALGLWPKELSSSATMTSTRWVRGGAETYIATFTISDLGESKVFLIKACVPAPAGRPLSDVLSDWVRRRKLVSTAGIAVPQLFYVGEGVLVEEYIEFVLGDRLPNEPMLCFELGRVVGLLGRLGFRPVQLLQDLRTRGHDVVVIDFGADLGDPIQPISQEFTRIERLLNEIEQAKIQLDERAISSLQQGFTTSFTAGLRYPT